MQQFLIAIVLFTVLALIVAPLWVRGRRVPGLPAAPYLEQKCMVLAEDVWRDYRITIPEYAIRRGDAQFLGAQLAAFVTLFQRMIDQGYDSEVRVWLDHIAEREGEAAAQRLILSAALARECAGDRYRDDPGFPARAMQVALEKLA